MDRFKNFFHGIYGIDALSCGLLFLSILINVLTAVIPVPALQRLNPIGLIPLLICILRFSLTTTPDGRERTSDSCG